MIMIATISWKRAVTGLFLYKIAPTLEEVFALMTKRVPVRFLRLLKVHAVSADFANQLEQLDALMTAIAQRGRCAVMVVA